MDRIQILCALDANYLPQLRVLLTSIRLNNPGETFGLYLMHSACLSASSRGSSAGAARRAGNSTAYLWTPLSLTARP